MHLSLEELLRACKNFRQMLIDINNQLPDDHPFDRLLLLVCMGKGGFLSLETLPNHATMELICDSSELFNQLFPYLDQQFLYQCMDNSSRAEIMQCVSTVRHSNIAKITREEHYYKALTIFYQVILEIVSPNDELWDEFIYRVMHKWNKLNRKFVQSIHRLPANKS